VDYHLQTKDGRQAGPYSLDQLKSFWTDGKVALDTPYRTKGAKKWVPLRRLESKLSPPDRLAPKKSGCLWAFSSYMTVLVIGASAIILPGIAALVLMPARRKGLRAPAAESRASREGREEKTKCPAGPGRFIIVPLFVRSPTPAPTEAQKNPVPGQETSSDHLSKGHLAILDALRGTCAFWVLTGHAGLACGTGGLSVLQSTPVAVDIFMFISGFLMTYHYRFREDREPWDSPSTWLKFYTRRFFRLAPVYYLLLTLTLIFRNDLYQADRIINTTFPPPWAAFQHFSAHPPPLNWASVAAHFTFLFGFIPQFCSDGSLPDWSIGLEMQFYLAFPFLMLFFRRCGYLGAAVACLVLWAVAHHLFGVYITTPSKMLGTFPQPSFLPLKIECFVFGILTAEAFWFRTLKTNLSMLLLLIVGGMVYLTNPSPYLVGAIGVCLYFTFLKGTSLSGRPEMKRMEEAVVNSRLVRFMADTSYGVYLIHLPVLWLTASFFASQPRYVSLTPVARLTILWGIMVSVTYPMAFIIFKSVEQPGIRWGRQALRRWKTPRRKMRILSPTSSIGQT
jgi:peptidoglycan/LPS O-acetylase OafA/YrhL